MCVMDYERTRVLRMGVVGLIAGVFLGLVSVMATLSPRGTIEIRTIPPSATVQLDNETVDLPTPFKAEMPVGAHQVAVSMPGYRTERFVIDIRAKTQALRLVKLEPLHELAAQR